MQDSTAASEPVQGGVDSPARMEVSQAVCRITNQLPRVHHRVDSLGWGSNDILPGKGRDRLRMVCHGGGCTRRRRGLGA